MSHSRYALVLCLSAPFLLASAWAQEPAYQHEEEHSVKLKVEALLRQEWTRSIFVNSTTTRNEDRRRARLQPRLEFGIKKLLLGVGGDFNFSSDKNTDPKPALLRDNYKS